MYILFAAFVVAPKIYLTIEKKQFFLLIAIVERKDTIDLYVDPFGIKNCVPLDSFSLFIVSL